MSAPAEQRGTDTTPSAGNEGALGVDTLDPHELFPSLRTDGAESGLPPAPVPYEEFNFASHFTPETELNEELLSELTTLLQSQEAATEPEPAPRTQNDQVFTELEARMFPPTTSTDSAAQKPVPQQLPQRTGRHLFDANESIFLSEFLQTIDQDLASILAPNKKPIKDPHADPFPAAPAAPAPPTGSAPAPDADASVRPNAGLRSLSFPPPTQPVPTAGAASAGPSSRQISDVAQSPGPARTVKRQRHIASEQRRRNQIRERFMRLAELLDLGRAYGARALGLNAGSGTGVEDEDLDDRSDTEEDLLLGCDEEEIQRRKRNAQRRARNRIASGKLARGRGRGRGGSAGSSGSKSAVLFQVVDLLFWLEVRNQELRHDIAALEALSTRPYAMGD
ncbi:hypothetical protein MSPP1_000405 [Malassezia sp. CBS 17886]|nr:hypothetical protein MSPP1_000405 [Malassezia sp. CBS 17886]